MAADGAPYSVDWRAQPRRPFKRGFIPYGRAAKEAGAAAEAAQRRSALGVDVVEDQVGDGATPAPVESFEELGVLPHWLLEGLRDGAQYEPTALQAQALPIALAGHNLVAVAPPGAGQVAAHLLPAVVHAEDQPVLGEDDPGPIVLVLTATQELAARVAEEADKLLQHSKCSARHAQGLRCVNVSGGGARSEKLKELSAEGAHLVVGTPKRVQDMAGKGQLSLLRVTLLAVDGADRMLDLGFAKELRELAEWVRPERQTLLFAGTWPRAMADLAKELCFAGGSAVHIGVSAAKAGAAKRPLQAAPEAAGKAKAAKAGPAASAKKKAKAADADFPADW